MLTATLDAITRGFLAAERLRELDSRDQARRIVTYRDDDRIRLITRNSFDFADHFPLVAEAIAALPARSCVLDGEAIARDNNGLFVFDLIRYRQHAFPLLGAQRRSYAAKADRASQAAVG